MKRWKAVVSYRSGAGLVDVEYDIEELEELQGIIERGPDWNTIEKVVVTLARVTVVGDTLEAAGTR